MLTLKKVAITGGLSCGKSSVCRILKELGAYVVSADEIVHYLLSSDEKLIQELIKLFGTSIVTHQQISRSRLAKLVFTEPKLLQKLEGLLHPAVYKEIDKDYQKKVNERDNLPLFIAEIPLLFESGGEKIFDKTVAVVADPGLCLQRFTQKTGYDQKEFERRAARQLSLLEKAKRSDYVIMNSSSFFNLQATTKELFQELIES